MVARAVVRRTELIMGMPISISIAPEDDPFGNADADMEHAFDYLRSVDEMYSPYKPGSEVSRISSGRLDLTDASKEMREIAQLCEDTKRLTHGYFDPWYHGSFDPSGLVKGWSLKRAAEILERLGYRNFCVDGAGDAEVRGRNEEGRPWRLGIRNPFDPSTLVKILDVSDRGVATSGTYIRGRHIYNPVDDTAADEIASLTVVGPNVYEADRIATAAFAMGADGIGFVASIPGCDAYQIDREGKALLTPGFARFVVS